jgi:hypothetical protein
MAGDEKLPLFDVANTLLEATAWTVTTGTLPAEEGSERPVRMAVTFRTPSTTLTLIMDKPYGNLLATKITETAALLGERVHLATPNGRPHHHV